MKHCHCFQRAITILDMEKRLPTCLKRRFRCGVKKNLNTVLGDDPRQCFRFGSYRLIVHTISDYFKGLHEKLLVIVLNNYLLMFQAQMLPAPSLTRNPNVAMTVWSDHHYNPERST